MRIEVLRQYEPRPVRWDSLPKPRLPETRLPRIGVVTPSYNQAVFLEATLGSVLDQGYPRLDYAVQDGGSRDASPQIVARHAARLAHWESAPDRGQADAISRGFARISDRLGPDDLMAWLNSDDLLAQGALRYVGEYFARHPRVDAIYGHRLIIDDQSREIGRWILPPTIPGPSGGSTTFPRRRFSGARGRGTGSAGSIPHSNSQWIGTFWRALPRPMSRSCGYRISSAASVSTRTRRPASTSTRPVPRKWPLSGPDSTARRHLETGPASMHGPAGSAFGARSLPGCIRSEYAFDRQAVAARDLRDMPWLERYLEPSEISLMAESRLRLARSFDGEMRSASRYSLAASPGRPC